MRAAELALGLRLYRLATVRGVTDAITNKDLDGMAKHYASAGNVLFFGNDQAKMVRGGPNYVQALSETLKNVKSIKVTPDDNPDVKVSGKLAVVAMTGVNEVVDNDGKKGSNAWRWTVELEQTGNEWKITHDHLSFVADPNRPLGPQEISGLAERAKCCLALMSVEVRMPRLDLAMRTAWPVQWYSEVDTIPPVGKVASVSVMKTPLLSAGREVGVLERGAVTFREVVKHLDLN